MPRPGERPVTDAQLEALVAVADHGSFTRAAAHLRMTQSAVSHAVAALESSLRVKLLVRDAGGARLTGTGERTVERAREVLRLKALMRQEAEATRGLRKGMVRVGSFGVTASRHLLPPILQSFSRRYPGIAVQVSEGTDQEVEQWLRQERLDLGFVTLPSDGFDTTYLAEDEMLVVLPADHPLAVAPRIDARRLTPYPFIMSTGGCEPAVQQILDEEPMDVRYQIREVNTIVEMVRDGAGITIKPTLSLPDPLPTGVIARPLDPPRPRLVGLAVARRKNLSPAAHAFLRVAASHRQDR